MPPVQGAATVAGSNMSDEAAPTPVRFDPVPALAAELGLPAHGIAAVVALLDEGNTVPFIARYRKERTGGLDEVQIRAIEEQRTYVVELEARRAAILASVAEQGKLTPELEARLRAARGKSELEDLYAPYRPRRKTRASVARERGLEPLAQRILAQGPDGDPAAEAAAFVGEQVASADDALAGARDRLRLAEGRYSAGAGSVIELGDAELSAANAAAQRVGAEYSLASARAALALALGRR